ncbi:MFS family permease [Peribacillus deserti]|uniref:MFS family permease n=1 Tax=Peribacillus deserti TaxID=673318 RepID=A0ABS2QLU4_9BACI|nr:MFS transporter [Peribacillus deserti]MBM7694147.1 MFS family permease [Peribacillus deserti]
MSKTFSVFKNPLYTKLFLANFTSQMGSVISIAAFMFYLLDRFGDNPAYASAAELMYSLPVLAVFFLVGVMADRMDRRKIAENCDWLCFGLTLGLIGALKIGVMPLIFLMLFLISGVQKFFAPAQSGIIQGVLSKEDYTAAAGLNQMVSSIFMLVGNGLGIYLYWKIGIYGAITANAVSFAVSALLIRSCRIPDQVRMPNGNHSIKDLDFKLVVNDFKLGMKYILNDKLLLSLLSGFCIFGIVNGGFSVMPIFIMKYKLAPNHYEEYSVILGIVFGSGVLLGSLIASAVASKIKLINGLIGGLFFSGFFVVLSSFAVNPFWFFTALFGTSLALPFCNIAIGGWMPAIVDPKMMGRVQGWITPLMMLAQSLMLAIISFTFPSVLSIEGLYWIVGGALILVSFIYYYLLPKYTDEVHWKAAEEKAV